MRNTDQLVLRVDSNSDGGAELTAEVYSRGFGGRSSAWFNTQTIVDFAGSLKAYPLNPPPYPTLSRGYPGKESHVAINVYPVGSRGQIGISIRLATPSDDVNRMAELCVVETELLTTYNKLSEFASELLIATESGTQATLIGEIL